MTAPHPPQLAEDIRTIYRHLTAKAIKKRIYDEEGYIVSISYIQKVRLGLRGLPPEKRTGPSVGRYKEYGALTGEALRRYFITHARNLIDVYLRCHNHFEETGHFNKPEQSEIRPKPEPLAAPADGKRADAAEHKGPPRGPQVRQPFQRQKGQHANPSGMLYDRFRGA